MDSSLGLTLRVSPEALLAFPNVLFKFLTAATLCLVPKPLLHNYVLVMVAPLFQVPISVSVIAVE